MRSAKIERDTALCDSSKFEYRKGTLILSNIIKFVTCKYCNEIRGKVIIRADIIEARVFLKSRTWFVVL